MKSTLREFLWTFLLALGIFLLLRMSIQTYVVDLPSMKPNVEPGWYIVVNKAVYHFSSPERGDVIVLHAPNNPGQYYIKRIIAIPGDKVEIKEGKVFLNDNAIEEDYIKEPTSYVMSPRKIPADEYFVLGDNRNVSQDSHNGWLVPRHDVVGKTWLVFWPPSAWRAIVHYPLEEEAEFGLQGKMSDTALHPASR